MRMCRLKVVVKMRKEYVGDGHSVHVSWCSPFFYLKVHLLFVLAHYQLGHILRHEIESCR